MIRRTGFILFPFLLLACSGGSGGGSGPNPSGMEGPSGETEPSANGTPVRMSLASPQIEGPQKTKAVPTVAGIDFSLYLLDPGDGQDILLGTCQTDTSGSCTVVVDLSRLPPGIEAHLMATSSLGIEAIMTVEVTPGGAIEIKLDAVSDMAADFYRAQCEAALGRPVEPGVGMFECVSRLMPECMERAMHAMMDGELGPDGTVQALFQQIRQIFETTFLQYGGHPDMAEFMRGDQAAMNQFGQMMQGSPSGPGMMPDVETIMEHIAEALQLLDESFCNIGNQSGYEEMMKMVGGEGAFSIVQNCPLGKIGEISPEIINHVVHAMTTIPGGFGPWQKPEVQHFIDEMIELDADPESTHEDREELAKKMMADMAAMALGNSGAGQLTAPWNLPSGNGGPPPSRWSQMPSCGEGPLFTHSPVDLEQIFVITPLGSLNPPGHVLPTDHMYWSMKEYRPDNTPIVEHNLYAPVDMTVTHIATGEDFENSQSTTLDYAIYFSPCREVWANFGHVASLSPELMAAFNASTNGFCNTGNSYRYCRREVNVEVNAGEVIGTIRPKGVDFGMKDARHRLNFVNPSRYREDEDGFDAFHTACPVDYFTADLKSQMESKFERTPGALPLCGEVNQDIVGTAQGNWFFEDSLPWHDESSDLALVHDNRDPAVAVLSIGNAAVGAGRYSFTPSSSGLVNRDFVEVTADGQIYCYKPERNKGGISQNEIFLVKLLDATTLKIEKQARWSCDEQPWAFTGNAVELYR